MLSLAWVVRFPGATTWAQTPRLLVWRSPFDATTATVHVLPHHRLNDIDQQHRPEDAS